MCKYYYKRHTVCGDESEDPWYVKPCIGVRLLHQKVYFTSARIPISFDYKCSKDPGQRNYVDVDNYKNCPTCKEKEASQTGSRRSTVQSR